MIEMSEDLYNRLRGFLNTLLASCKNCFRNKQECEYCDLKVVPYLVQRMNTHDADSLYARLNRIDHSKRFEIIAKEIQDAGRPLLSREIDPHKRLCAKGLKYWSLHKMVKIGILKIVKINGKTHFAINKEN